MIRERTVSRPWSRLAMAVAITLVTGITDAAAQESFVPLDLRAVANMGFQDSTAGDGRGGWTDQGGNDMRFLPTGRQTFRDIPFDIIDPKSNNGKSSLILFGTARPYFPVDAEVKGIGKKATSVYFLHGAGWCSDKQGATYTVMYDDGTKVDIPIRGGKEIGNWWQPQDGEHYRVGWFGPNLANANVGLLIFPWQNPSPDKVIASITFTSAKISSVPCVVAVTLSGSDAKIPEKGFNKLETGAATLGAAKMVGEVKPEDKLPPLEEGKNAYRMAEKSSSWQSSDVLEKLPMGGVADVSFLNDRPAGNHGRLQVKDGRPAWSDGTPAKFFSTSTSYSIQFPNDMKEARRNAQWLAANGINLVRIHHFAHSGSSGTIFDLYEGQTPTVNKLYVNPYITNTRKYDSETWDKLDMFLAALKEEGIYAHLSMLVFPWFGRAEAAESDIPPARTSPWGAYKTEGAQIAVKEYTDKLNVFIKDVFTHKNPHTGMTYAEDPMFTSVELMNEDSIFYRGNDPHRLSAYFFLELHEQYNNWLLAKYGSAEKLRQAWGEGVTEDWETPLKDLNFMKKGRQLPPAKAWTEVPAGFTPVDISACANTSYSDTSRDVGTGGWFAEGREVDMRFFPTGKLVMLDVPFDVSSKGPVLTADKEALPKVGKDKDQPNPKAANPWTKSTVIPVSGKARSLYFLHIAGWMPKNNEPFAFYDVIYADGSKEAIGIRNGIETSDWGDPTNGQACRVGWTGMTLRDQQVGMNIFAWDNPNPDKQIAKIVTRVEGNPAVLILAGLTLSQAPAKLPKIDEMPEMADWLRFVRLWGYNRFSNDGWTPGLLKRASDQIRFLYEVQTSYFLGQKKFIEGLGFKGLFLGSNWFTPPLMSAADRYSNAQLDVMDTHNYGGSVGLMRSPGAGTLSSGPNRVLNKPFMISEWNPALKEEFRLCVFPLISLYGQCLNGWDMPMQFGIRRIGWGFYKYFWEFCANYPSDLVQYPQMALAIRRGDLKEGQVVYKKMVSKPEIFAETLEPKHEYKNPYFAVGKVGTEFCDAPQADFLARDVIEKAWDAKAGVVNSSTGELSWDYEKGIAICRAPRTQGAVGFLPRIPAIELPCGSLSVAAPFAAVWISSLTDKAVSESPKILIGATGRQDVMDLSNEKDKGPTYKPMIIEAIKGKIVLKSSLADKLKVYGVGFDGRAVKELQTQRQDGKIEFSFDTMDFKGPYVLVTSEAVELAPASAPAKPAK